MLTDRLSERLKELAASAEQLPAGVQDHLAERLAVELDNAVWDAQLRDPAWVDVPEPTHTWLPHSRKEGRRAMATRFTVGEGVVWVTNFGLEHRMDAEVVRMAHGRVLIRVLERAANQQRAQLVERWVEPESLRKS